MIITPIVARPTPAALATHLEPAAPRTDVLGREQWPT